MTIAELFVNIGLKGADTTVKGLKGIAKGVDNIASTSLAAKAAVLGMIVGMERLTGFASQVGMDLHKFTTTTGLSSRELQKWQYAAGRFDVSGEEMTNTIMGVQSAMTDMLMGKGQPESLGLLADAVGFDPKKANDTFYVMRKIQQFAKTQPPGLASNLLKSFGISANMFQALKSMNLEKDKIAEKDIITDEEKQRLVDINIAWKDFWHTLKTLSIKAVAKDGIEGIKVLTDAFKSLMDIGKYVFDLTEKFKFLKVVLMAIGAGIAAYFAPITTAVAAATYLLSSYQKLKEGKSNVFTDFNKAIGVDGAVQYVSDSLGLSSNQQKEGYKDSFASNVVPMVAPGSNAQPAPTTVTQSNVFHIDGSESPKATQDAVQRALSGAARQMSSQRGGF